MEPQQVSEQRVLTSFLGKRKKLTAAEAAEAVGGDVAPTLEALTSRGLLQATQKGRRKEVAWELSKEGKASLKPPKAPRASRPKPVTSEDLAALESRLMTRLDQLASLLGAKPAPASLESAIPQAVLDANKAGNHGGLVPLPEVRKLALQRTGASRAQFDALLLDLERRYLVDLKIANDPRRPDAAEGIDVPGRGLVYFILAK